MEFTPSLTVIDVLVKHGIGTALTLVGCYLFWKIIQHILKQQEVIMKMATEQNQHWQSVISEHTASAKAFHEEVKEAHRFQREEHKEMITTLGRINGYKNG